MSRKEERRRRAESKCPNCRNSVQTKNSNPKCPNCDALLRLDIPDKPAFRRGINLQAQTRLRRPL